MTELQDHGPIRTVFFGTPDYAVPCLRALAADPRFEVSLVVTQPDRRAGRGKQLKPPPVKVAAEGLRIPVYQPATLRDAESREPLERANADVFVVAAFGLIFGKKSLAIPRQGTINLHASILPRYRGAAPVTAAILNGDRETGVSLMVVELGLDSGPVIDVARVPIEFDDTTESLTSKLARAGARLAVERIPAFVRGERLAVPQAENGVSTVRQLEKQDGRIDWGASAETIERMVRAMWPWPRAWAGLRGEPVQIHAAVIAPTESGLDPGTILVDKREVRVTTGSGDLRLIAVQPAGGKPISPTVWTTGKRIASGERFDFSPPSGLPPLIQEL
jgi:methionyl-tRNA formyltransferase